MNRNFDESAEDREHRKNLAAMEAAKYDFEHWSKTGELRKLQVAKWEKSVRDNPPKRVI